MAQKTKAQKTTGTKTASKSNAKVTVEKPVSAASSSKKITAKAPKVAAKSTSKQSVASASKAVKSSSSKKGAAAKTARGKDEAAAKTATTVSRKAAAPVSGAKRRAAPASAAKVEKPAAAQARTAAKKPAAVKTKRAVAAAVPPSAASAKISAPVGSLKTAVAAQKKVTKPKDIAEKTAAQRLDPQASKKPVNQRHGFKTNEYIVYPAHGVGQIVGIEEQEIAGMSLELFVITFEKEKLTLRVPTGKLESVGMRKLSDEPSVKKAMDILKGRARIKRTMWSRRAQEYDAKINSGDLVLIAEVVRDLYRSETQPEQSYSERQLYEAALDRMAREIAAVEKLDERGAVQRITDVLAKSAKGRRAAEEVELAEAEDESKAA